MGSTRSSPCVDRCPWPTWGRRSCTSTSSSSIRARAELPQPRVGRGRRHLRRRRQPPGPAPEGNRDARRPDRDGSGALHPTHPDPGRAARHAHRRRHGYYTSKDLPGYFRRHGPGLQIDMPEPLERMFLTDIEDGIADTGVKAAVIKVVTDEPGVTPDVERVLHNTATCSGRPGYSSPPIPTPRCRPGASSRSTSATGRRPGAGAHRPCGTPPTSAT